MADPMRVASMKPAAPDDLVLLPRMANRHGLITGATGTGKTVTLQTIAEQLSDQGISVFLADVKGDLAGLSQAGGGNPKVDERNQMLGVIDAGFRSYPVAFWDIFGEGGHPIRATVSDMGPLLLGRLLRLNDVQTGVLNAVFRIADDSGLLLLDLNDLRSMLHFVGEHAADYVSSYGNISRASIGSIQRGLLELDSEGAETFFGEPMLNVLDLIQNAPDGRGMINILAADKLIQKPKVYATFLLWLLSELFENLPEVGDQDKPKLVFFFDEAHLLFDDTPPALLEKIEQVVRLVRSKAVGVFFVSQNPIDIPESVLAQLGNRVQHALRAFTPKDQKAIKAMAETFRPNPAFSIEQVITELGVGEALVSMLDEKGAPSVTQRAFIYPPHSHLGAIDAAQRQAIVSASVHAGTYDRAIDRESAQELLQKRAEEAAAEAAREQEEAAAAEERERAEKAEKATRRGGGRRDSAMDTLAKSAARAIGSQVGRQLVRGMLGSLFGRSSRRR